MKKLVLFVVLMIVASISGIEAQNNTFGKGDLALNLDYGIGSFTKWEGYSFNSNIPQHSIGASLEYGIMEGIIKGKGSIGVGGQFGLGFGSKYGVDATRIRIATRGMFHYQFVPQLDTYAGFNFLFCNINKFKWDDGIGGKYDDSDVEWIYPEFVAGLRFMLSDNFGLNTELSYGTFAYAAFGVCFKF